MTQHPDASLVTAWPFVLVQGSFFKLQRMYGGAKSKLGKAMNEVVSLRAELRAAQAQ